MVFRDRWKHTAEVESMLVLMMTLMAAQLGRREEDGCCWSSGRRRGTSRRLTLLEL